MCSRFKFEYGKKIAGYKNKSNNLAATRELSAF